MTTKILSSTLLGLLIASCSMSSISVKYYDDTNLSTIKTYAWYGMGTVSEESDDSASVAISELVEEELQKILKEKGLEIVSLKTADILISFEVQRQNALKIEEHYRKRYRGVFSEDVNDVRGGNSSALLQDTAPPLYTGQERGTLVVTLYNTNTHTPVRAARSILAHSDYKDKNIQMTRLNKTLVKLIEKLFK